MDKWPSITVGELVDRRIETVAIEADTMYDTLGVRWYGRGAYLRRSSRPRAKTLNRARTGDFVFCRIDAQNGPFAVVPPALDGALATNEFPLYTVDEDELDARFLALCFSSQNTLDKIGKLREGRDGRARWKEADFESWVVPHPPTIIQRLIVDIISVMDDSVAATEQEAERLATILKIRRSDLANDLQFTSVPAGEAFNIRLGRQRSPDRASGPSMTPYLRSGNVGPDILRLDDVMSMDFNERERERYALREGDVLVSEGSAGDAAVGMPATWRGEIAGPVCFQNTLLRYRAIVDITMPEFLRHWCLWAFESGSFRDTAPAQVNIKHIGDKRAKQMAVRLPAMNEQEAIVAELDPLSNAVASLRAEAERLRLARFALLDAILAGNVNLLR